MLRRGFSLANVVILSALITLIGYAGLMIVNINAAGSRAENTYLWAEKAANAGLLEAMKRIQATGFCDVNQTFTGNIGNATYEVSIRRSSRICFIRSEGKLGKAKVIKTGILQAYYGVGLYTVRGNVDAEIGSEVRFSGCDNTANPPCFVPAFIASGSVTTAIPPQSCSADNGGYGIYGGTTGEEAIITYVKYTDLIPLFFNVNCFNQYDSTGCDIGLLQIFEQEYGINPSNNRQDMFFDNEWGIPRVDFSGLPPAGACEANGQLTGPWWDPTYVVDVSSSDLTGCTDIYIDIPSNAELEIEGTVNRYLNIYTFDNDITLVRINSEISSTGFTLYSTRPVYIRSDLEKARIIINNENLYIRANRTLQDSILVLGFDDVSDTNNTTTANGNIYTLGDITLNRTYVFARHIRFASWSDVNVYNSVLYVYAYACPNCSRTGNDSLTECRNSIGWYYNNFLGWIIDGPACGWYGRRNGFYFGGDDNAISTGNYEPSIVISNNSTVHFTRARDTIYFIGAFIGEDITYLSYYGGAGEHFLGFLVRNFPQSESLNIRIYSDFILEFDKAVLDKLAQNFWYFRKIQCIRDDINPRTQLIHTRLTAY